jgi:hemerythrin-like domain-containing protein
MMDFAHHARRHLILENAVILPIARARLTEADLNAMKRHMLERRSLKPTLGE